MTKREYYNCDDVKHIKPSVGWNAAGARKRTSREVHSIVRHFQFSRRVFIFPFLF